ncbi:hypothetical protein BaRGS_00035134 [Batillaria attramentaria]|uniref:Secreted protein n=1 Tax=Batillaria attramentaria TaxID=370345 RepID=A0ABD0JGC9_9CAEN
MEDATESVRVSVVQQHWVTVCFSVIVYCLAGTSPELLDVNTETLSTSRKAKSRYLNLFHRKQAQFSPVLDSCKVANAKMFRQGRLGRN